MKDKIKTVAFDADDTLWDNETYFQNPETQFYLLLADHLPQLSISQELFKVEIRNLWVRCKVIVLFGLKPPPLRRRLQLEIMSGKNIQDYQKLLKHLDGDAAQFLMLGNSLKSDRLPVLELGDHAAHIPYHMTWAHEAHSQEIDHPNFLSLKNIDDILQHLSL